jgi:DNA-binding transcriptional LysR family regulator
MLDLNDFRYFVRIVDCRGLTAASRDLNVPKSTVSHRLQQLEAGLGVRLINRTSRSMSVTDAGEHFYRHAVSMLEHARLAENTVRGRLAEPSGTIRFTSAVATSLFALQPILPDFIGRYPKIHLVQHTSDDQVDIVGAGYDVAIRAHSGPLSDSMLVQRTLAPASWYLFASPDYIGRRGLPLTPQDLAQHDTLSMLRPGHPSTWKLMHSTIGEVVIPIAPRFTGSDLMMLMEAARSGLGIVALPSYVCRAELATGSLRPILPDWSAGQASISAVVPFRNGLQPSVRVFLDYLAGQVPRIVA